MICDIFLLHSHIIKIIKYEIKHQSGTVPSFSSNIFLKKKLISSLSIYFVYIYIQIRPCWSTPLSSVFTFSTECVVPPPPPLHLVLFLCFSFSFFSHSLLRVGSLMRKAVQFLQCLYLVILQLIQGTITTFQLFLGAISPLTEGIIPTIFPPEGLLMASLSLILWVSLSSNFYYNYKHLKNIYITPIHSVKTLCFFFNLFQ